MKRNKVFVIGPVPPPVHGQSAAVRQLLESELSRGFNFILFNKALVFSDVSDHGNFRTIKILRDFQLISSLLFGLLFQSPNICYLTLAQSRYGVLRDAFIIILCSLFSPVIIHLHFGEFKFQLDKLKSIEKRLIEFSLRRVTKAVMLSKRFTSILEGRIAPNRICVVHNGLRDTDEAKPAPLNQFQSEIKILFLSNLQLEKGVQDVLLVLGQLKKAGIPFQAVIAGPYPSENLKAQVIGLVSDLNIQGNVSLPGEVSGKIKDSLFANADVFLFLPNQVEGQPLVIIEALMAGLPIISTPQGGIVDMVIDGENGFLVPVHGIQITAEKVTKLVTCAALRREMGSKSRQIYLKKFTENVYLDGIKNVFEVCAGE